MQAILADWQIARLSEVFQVDRLEILATRVELPPQLSWEVVATQTPQGAFFPDTEFLENIQDYKYNRLINIGGDSKYRTILIATAFRYLAKLFIPLQGDTGGDKGAAGVQDRAADHGGADAGQHHQGEHGHGTCLCWCSL